MGLTHDDLKYLSEPFDNDQISIKIQSTNKDRTKAMLVQYVQHTEVYKRLEEIDPAWSCEVMSKGTLTETMGTKTVTTIYVSMRMTVKGVVRENVGDGDDYKSAYSDALKRVAMLFGVGRWLYDSETVWVPYNEQTDKYKSWTIEEFQKYSRIKPAPKQPQAQNKPEGTGSDVAYKLAKLKFETGQYTGKTMEEVLKEDSANEYKYASWLVKQEQTNLSKITLSQKKYLEFARQEGVL